MLGRSILASGVTADSRVFVYEVSGLRQNDQTVNNNHEIRHSDTILMQVPFSRMNEFMQQINRAGAHIVNIRTGAGTTVQHNPETQHVTNAEGKKKKH